MKEHHMRPLLIAVSCLALFQPAPGQAQETPDDSTDAPPQTQNVAAAAGKVALNAAYSRTAFYRKEENAALKIQVANHTGQALPASSLHVTGEKFLQQTKKMPPLAGGQSVLVELPVDTSLRPGRYDIALRLEDSAQKTVGEELKLEVVIVPRALQRIPVILWGTPDSNAKAKRLGFTGSLIRPIDHEFVCE